MKSVEPSWEEVPLKTITLKIGSGATPRGGKKSYKKEGISLIRSLNVYDFKFEWKNLAFIDHKQADALSNVEVKSKDILLNITGASVARCCMVPKKTLPARVNQHVAIVRIDKDRADPNFILNVINSHRYKHHLLTLAQGGATREALTKETIQNFEVPLPILSIQQKIASILSAYDDLIENNMQRIKILEEMAQNLYREWFVKFRFPGHEKVKMVDSPLGGIPEGWIVKNIGEVTSNYDRLRKPLSKMQRAKRKGSFPYYGAAKIFDYIDDYIFDGIFLLFAEDGSVITPDRKPVLQYVTGKFWANNHTHILQGKEEISTEFLYLLLSDIDISGYITGAAQPKITQANLNRIPVLAPTKKVLQYFNEIIKDMFQLKTSIDMKNSLLRQTRDLLLPKLISGELDVSELDIEIRDEVA